MHTLHEPQTSRTVNPNLTLSVIIPCFNEAESIEEVLGACGSGWASLTKLSSWMMAQPMEPVTFWRKFEAENRPHVRMSFIMIIIRAKVRPSSPVLVPPPAMCF